MNIFKKLFINWAIWSADKTGYTMQKIGALRYASVMSLIKKWSLEEYKKLEVARALAETEEHWFEELQCLVDQVSILIKYQGDKQLFYAANKRLKELSVIFDMDDEAFKAKFQEKYMSFTDVRILKQVDPCLRGFCDYFYERADFMLAHLQLNTAILCGKAILKISALSSVVSFEDKMESLFQIAVGYGNQREVGKAMEYYNKAISLAKESDDTTYQYISIIRMLLICHVCEDFSPILDRELLAVEQELLDFCERHGINPFEMGKELLKRETNEFKKNMINEAMPFFDNVMVSFSIDYHASLQDINAELNIELDEREDIPYEIPTPPGMAPCDKFRLYLSYSKAECVYKHIQCSMYHAMLALEIAENLFSDYHEAMAIHAIGQAYESCGNISEAIRMYQMVVDMFGNSDLVNSDLSLSNQLLYTTLYEIGNLQKESEPEKATDVLTKAISLIDESSDMDKDFSKLNALISRSIAFKYLGEVCSSESDMNHAIDLLMAQVSKCLKYMDGDQRDNYWNKLYELIMRIASLSDVQSGNDLRVKLYDLILLSKGFLLSAECAIKAAIYSDDTPDSIRAIYENMEESKQKLINQAISSEPALEDRAYYYSQKISLKFAISHFVNQYFYFVDQNFTCIAHCLDDNDVVVDFFDYETEDNGQQYMAFVYQKGSEVPHLVKVCKESDIQQIFNEVSSLSYGNGQRYNFTDVYNSDLGYSNFLFNSIFGPIADVVPLNSKLNLHIIPSGALHKIPFESLVVSEGSKIIASDYYKSIARLSNARVLKSKIHDDRYENIVLFGGLDYGCDNNLISDIRGYRLDYDNPQISPLHPWSNLSHGLKEIDNISFMWGCTRDEQSVIKYIKKEGTADRFYKLHRNNTSIIHIATHGFFESSSTAEHIPALKGMSRPMDLSGIVMSNGNQGWLYGSPLQREGIITASDIAKMDLSNTSLVVLSACNSGNGVVGSDGVYGLQRAFKKAGVKTILMSLWNESDEAGALFMTTFYRFFLVDKYSLAHSYNAAKNEVRKCFPDPKYWANFVLLD